jgi:nitrogen regulatory protein P-II 1
MKRVEVELSAHHLDDVKQRLRLIGIPGMTAQACSGLRTRNETYRGAVMATALVERIRLDIVVTDDMVDNVVRAVLTVVRRDDGADGRISIAPIDEVFRISTGEAGADAL